MASGVVMDTGPLVAYLSAREVHHEWAVEQFRTLDLPFLTCEPVLTEACFIAARNRVAPARLLDLLERRVFRIAIDVASELARVRALMERYANVPMSLADASLVRLAEITGAPICTLDADFAVYRAHGRRPLELITPPRRGLHEP